jgi:hypothetical protein
MKNRKRKKKKNEKKEERKKVRMPITLFPTLSKGKSRLFSFRENRAVHCVFSHFSSLFYRPYIEKEKEKKKIQCNARCVGVPWSFRAFGKYCSPQLASPTSFVE